MAATPYYLSELVPTNLIADYPLEGISTAGAVGSVNDYSGNARLLFPTGANPNYELNSVNGRPSIKFNGEPPLKYTGTVTPKHVFALVKYDLAANFGGTYRGLLTGPASGDIWVGDNGASSTKFTNLGLTIAAYYKSHVSYIESNQQAPFAAFELIELQHNSGISLDGIQIGQQRDYDGVLHAAAPTRRWFGRIADLKLSPTVLSGTDLTKLKLYYDLKFLAWLTGGYALNFPSPDITGIPYEHFDDMPRPWDDVVASHTYDDGGRSFNRISSNPAKEWQLDFRGGLTYAQTQIYDAFWDAVGIDRPFSFTDKFGTTWTNVRVKEYSRSHDKHLWHLRRASFKLCQFPQ